MQLHAVPHNLLLWNYTLRDPMGRSIRLTTGFIRKRGSFTYDGVDYTICREAFMAGPFTLKDYRGVIATAKKSIMQRSFQVEMSLGTLILAAENPFMRAFTVEHGSQAIGHITPAHIFTRRAFLEINADLSLPECTFVFFLAMFTWRRAAGAAGS